MLTVSRSGASQKRLDPHSPQKPRRAALSLSGLAIQRKPMALRSTRCSRRTAVAANTCPLHRLHSTQWQSSTSRSGPCRSKRTAPQRQRPVARALTLIDTSLATGLEPWPSVHTHRRGQSAGSAATPGRRLVFAGFAIALWIFVVIRERTPPARVGLVLLQRRALLPRVLSSGRSARAPGRSKEPREARANDEPASGRRRSLPEPGEMTKPARQAGFRKGGERDSNPRPPGPQPGALPTELPPPCADHPSGAPPEESLRCDGESPGR